MINNLVGKTVNKRKDKIMYFEEHCDPNNTGPYFFCVSENKEIVQVWSNMRVSVGRSVYG